MNYEIFLLLFILLSRGLSTTHLKKACQVILSFFCSYSVFSLKIMNANAYLALEKVSSIKRILSICNGSSNTDLRDVFEKIRTFSQSLGTQTVEHVHII